LLSTKGTIYNRVMARIERPDGLIMYDDYADLRGNEEHTDGMYVDVPSVTA
jgi:hypothetical protein